jgi:hypothetical protein
MFKLILLDTPGQNQMDNAVTSYNFHRSLLTYSAEKLVPVRAYSSAKARSQATLYLVRRKVKHGIPLATGKERRHGHPLTHQTTTGARRAQTTEPTKPTRTRAARWPRAYKPTENNKLTSQKKKTTKKVSRAAASEPDAHKRTQSHRAAQPERAESMATPMAGEGPIAAAIPRSPPQPAAGGGGGGGSAAEAPVLIFVYFHKAIRAELERMHAAAVRLATTGPAAGAGGGGVAALEARCRFLFAVYRHHCHAEDAVRALRVPSSAGDSPVSRRISVSLVWYGDRGGYELRACGIVLVGRREGRIS